MKKVLLIILTLLVVTVLGLMYSEKQHNETSVSKDEVIPTADAIDNEQTYCFFGLDTRTPDDRGRSDVIMLIRVNKETENIKVVSVYRDTLMDMGGLIKCNSAYEYGGPFYAMDMLEKNLDLDIDGYVSAEFLSVINMIDALGGVNLDLTDEEVRYSNQYISEMNELYHKDSPLLEPGKQKLNGVQAVGYSRVRYTEGWDYKRTERQRTILNLMAEAFKKADADTQEKVMRIFFEDFYTDMSEQDITNMADSVVTYDFAETAGFPRYKKGVTVPGLGSCVAAKDYVRNVTWLHEFLYGDDSYMPSSEVTETAKAVEGVLN